MKQLIFGGVRLPSTVANAGLLVLRLIAGLSIAYGHGWGKMPPSDRFMQMVASLGFPGEMAWLTAFTEFLGGIALALGLATRPVALAMIVNFSVVVLLAHANDPFRDKELPLQFLGIAVLFACIGAGRFSVDRIIR